MLKVTNKSAFAKTIFNNQLQKHLTKLSIKTINNSGIDLYIDSLLTFFKKLLIQNRALKIAFCQPEVLFPVQFFPKTRSRYLQSYAR